MSSNILYQLGAGNPLTEGQKAQCMNILMRAVSGQKQNPGQYAIALTNSIQVSYVDNGIEVICDIYGGQLSGFWQETTTQIV